MNKILIIADDWEMNELTVLDLEQVGIQVFTATTLVEGEKVIQKAFPDIILLDVHLLDRNSFEFVRKICKYENITLIFVTMQHYIEQKLKEIVKVGEGIFAKPFYPQELMMCVQTQLKRKESNFKPPVIEIDNLRIDIEQKEVYKDGQIINLYTKEKKLLFYLVQNANKVISSQQIISDIWGRNEKTNEKTVVVHISTLRRKLGDSYSKGNRIKTVRGFGYKFIIN